MTISIFRISKIFSKFMLQIFGRSNEIILSSLCIMTKYCDANKFYSLILFIKNDYFLTRALLNIDFAFHAKSLWQIL